jgi:hypothetical protein
MPNQAKTRTSNRVDMLYPEQQEYSKYHYVRIGSSKSEVVVATQGSKCIG